jgi:cupin fold WbuC family metalloprotein
MRIFPRSLLDELESKAKVSPRARAHHTIHDSAEDPVQRFIVAALPDSYFRPHRHVTKSELALILRGSVQVVTFDDAGKVVGRYDIGEGTDSIAYETPQATWHTLLPGPSGVTFLEVKQGPYDPATAQELASWAPAEGGPGVTEYLAALRAPQRQG